MTDNERSELFKKAAEARLKSYSPYSGYSVGAALLCSDGLILRPSAPSAPPFSKPYRTVIVIFAQLPSRAEKTASMYVRLAESAAR